MHETPSGAPALTRTLDYTFRDPSLLQSALIHTSYVNERPGRGLESNERLEFLGDAVLGVVVAKWRLQQVTQARFESTPVYNLVDHTGPGHAPVFVVEVKAGPDINARGSGHSKRAAQQAAAHAALQMLNVKEGYEEPQDEFDEAE